MGDDPKPPFDSAASRHSLNQHIHSPPTNPLMSQKENTFMRTFISRTLIALAILIGGIFIGRAVTTFTNPMGNGIIAIPTWGHGILLCGEEATETEIVTEVEGATLITNKWGKWTINTGHLQDPQFDELKRVATFACPYKGDGGLVATHNHFIKNDGDKVIFWSVQESPDNGTLDIAVGIEVGAFTRVNNTRNHDCDYDFNIILVK